MNVRVNKVRRGDALYRYVQLVEAYRRKSDGKPTVKVLASFGDLSELETENLKRFVEASRNKQRLVLPDEAASRSSIARAVANYRYLDVAVLFATWNQWRLSALIDDLLPDAERDVPTSAVVAALAIHRCTDPNSKLQATKWFGTTALPELQDVTVGAFNNSRVHRALTELESIEQPLQERLSTLVRSEQGPPRAMFLDLTDTWFVGAGPDIARSGRTKEGMYRKRVGIALLCDQDGFPLRWKTIEGSYHEPTVMSAVAKELGALEWTGGVPFVVDRAMGQATYVEDLVDSRLHFVTALPWTEFDGYTDQIPYAHFQDLVLAGTDTGRDADLKRLHAACRRAKLERVRDDRWVLDLGILERPRGRTKDVTESRAVQALRLAVRLQAERVAGATVPELAERHGIVANTIGRHLKLLKLAPPLRERVLRGEADGVQLNALERVAKLPEAEQEAAFNELPAAGRALRASAASHQDEQPSSLRVRAIVQFNPDRFLNERRIAREQVRELDAFVAELNRRLRSPSSRRTQASVVGEVESHLRKMSLLTAFKVQVTALPDHSTPTWLVELVRQEAEWERRRRYDGFNVFVTAADVTLAAPEVVETYFAKDAVEKDFQTIKSELELRPVHHRTDAKVRAHVTLCMLALLLERTLERRLHSRGVHVTAPALLTVLKTCHANRYDVDWGRVYSVTQPSAEQATLLNALNLAHLAGEHALGEAVSPR